MFSDVINLKKEKKADILKQFKDVCKPSRTVGR